MPMTPRMKNTRDSKDVKEDKKKLKKRGGPKDDDDVDEHGNIEGLIAYEEDEDSDESETSLTKSELRRLKKYGKLPESLKSDIRGGRSPRKAALKARDAIRKKLKKEDSRNKSPITDSTYEDEPIVKRKKFGFVSKKRVVESESESDGETLGSEDTDDEDEVYSDSNE